jgi:hypothetical protein
MFAALLIVAALVFVQAAPAQAGQVTSVLMVPFEGTVASPFAACPEQVAVSGNLHIVSLYDSASGALDLHLNLDSTKGVGPSGTYIIDGANHLELPTIPGNPVRALFKIYPPDPCKSSGGVNASSVPMEIEPQYDETGNLTSASATMGID